MTETVVDSHDAPPTEDARGDLALVRTILRNRDVYCPLCGYNLRNLDRDRCPECEHRLVPTVSAAEIRLGPLIASLVPGIFSGFCALFLLIPIIVQPMTGGGRAPWPAMALDAFGFSSGAVAIALIVRRRWFLSLPARVQGWWVVGIWSTHILALLVVLALALA